MDLLGSQIVLSSRVSSPLVEILTVDPDRYTLVIVTLLQVALEQSADTVVDAARIRIATTEAMMHLGNKVFILVYLLEVGV